MPLIFFVSGMFCGTCGQTVEGRVARLAGVQSARLNFASKLLRVELAPEADVEATTSLIERELERGGFAGKRQTAGWMASYSRDLENEQAQAVPAWLLATVVFFAMWSSTAAFAKYLGELSMSGERILSVVSTVMGTPAILLGVVPFARAGFRALFRSRLLTLDLFVAIGGLSALGVSLLGLWSGSYRSYVDSSAMVLVVLLIAKVLEARLTRSLVGRILYHLGGSEDRVERLASPETGAIGRQLLATQVRRGDLVAFEAGQTIMFDGAMIGSQGSLNLHLLNGEAGQSKITTGDPIPAGAIAGSRIEMRVSEPIGHRAIDGWAESALISHCRPHRYSDVLRRWEIRLTAWALAGAALLGLWRYTQTGQLALALESFFIGVLIFCPCLFVSILPLAKQMAHLTLARRGVLLYRAESLFDLHGIERIYLDKTGTLEALESTFVGLDSVFEQRTRSLLTTLREFSGHPVLIGLDVSGTSTREKSEPQLTETPGQGVRAYWPDTDDTLVVGRPSFVDALIRDSVDLESSEPVVALNGKVVGRIVTVSRYNQRALNFLKRLCGRLSDGLQVEILSGDPKAEAGLNFAALAPGQIVYRGNLAPQEKAQYMAANALFVGDGLNDTLAFAKATVSFRVGQRVRGFAPVDLQLLSPEIERVVEVWDYSHRFVKILRQTALLALSYNAIAWTLAAYGWFTPLGAVLAMLTSLALMLASSLRLLFDPLGERGKGSDTKDVKP